MQMIPILKPKEWSKRVSNWCKPKTKWFNLTLNGLWILWQLLSILQSYLYHTKKAEMYLLNYKVLSMAQVVNLVEPTKTSNWLTLTSQTRWRTWNCWLIQTITIWIKSAEPLVWEQDWLVAQNWPLKKMLNAGKTSSNSRTKWLNHKKSMNKVLLLVSTKQSKMSQRTRTWLLDQSLTGTTKSK